MKNAMPVIQFTLDGEKVAEYESCNEAGRQIGINGGNISQCCKNRRRTAGGYKWRYAIENNSSSETA